MPGIRRALTARLAPIAQRTYASFMGVSAVMVIGSPNVGGQRHFFRSGQLDISKLPRIEWGAVASNALKQVASTGDLDSSQAASRGGLVQGSHRSGADAARGTTHGAAAAAKRSYIGTVGRPTA